MCRFAHLRHDTPQDFIVIYYLLILIVEQPTDYLRGPYHPRQTYNSMIFIIKTLFPLIILLIEDEKKGKFKKKYFL